MDGTPFPSRPTDVATLTVQEFTCGLDMESGPGLDVICQRFINDANRAVVWIIRYRAMRKWRAHSEMAESLHTSSEAALDVCAVAAGFALNDEWEFDASAFGNAVQAAARPKT